MALSDLDFSEPKKPPHHLHVSSIDTDGHISWRVSCPWEPEDRRRDCLYGREPDSPCEWQAWENGDHRPDCVDPLCTTVHEVSGEEVQACWNEEPHECDGFETSELGHCHPDNGCGVIEAFDWGGMGDSVFLGSEVIGPVFPVKVWPDWEDGNSMSLNPEKPQ